MRVFIIINCTPICASVWLDDFNWLPASYSSSSSPPPPAPSASPAPPALPQSLHTVVHLGCRYSLPPFPTVPEGFHSSFSFARHLNPLQPRPPIFTLSSSFHCSFHCSCWNLLRHSLVLLPLLSIFFFTYSCFPYFYLSFRKRRTS